MKRGQKPVNWWQRNWKWLLISLLLALPILGGLYIGSQKDETPLYEELEALANSLPRESAHGCVTWTGRWSYTDDIFSGAAFNVLEDMPIAGCSQMIILEEIHISRRESEDKLLVLFDKEYNTMFVLDYMVHFGVPFPDMTSDELILLTDGLGFLLMSEDKQNVLGRGYTGPAIVWDGVSQIGCVELVAIMEMSRINQINSGNLDSLYDSNCG